MREGIDQIRAAVVLASLAGADTPDTKSSDFWYGTAADGGPTVRLHYFYSPTCPHCHQVMTVDLPPLLQRYRDYARQRQMTLGDMLLENRIIFLFSEGHARARTTKKLDSNEKWMIKSK